MKHSRLIKFIILFVNIVLIAIAVLYVWQKNNIDAYMTYKQYNAEEIEEKQAKIQESEQKIMEETETIPEKFFTDEQLQLLNEGKLTIEEAEKIIESKRQYDADNNGTNNSEAKISSRVSEIVASIYALKADFSCRVDGLVGQAKSEVASTPVENRTPSWKSGLLSKYASLASSMESQCDGKMNALLGELKKELEKTNQDTGMVDEIRNLYYQEKATKKASLLSQY